MVTHDLPAQKSRQWADSRTDANGQPPSVELSVSTKMKNVRIAKVKDLPNRFPAFSKGIHFAAQTQPWRHPLPNPAGENR
jgi:hypothetical protein